MIEIPLENINDNLRKTHTHTIIIKLNFDKGHYHVINSSLIKLKPKHRSKN